jgi:hypothetical protein
VFYLAHALAGDVEANLARAKRWLAFFAASVPDDVVVIAPWIAHVEAVGSDGDEEQRERGLRGDCAVVARCDALLLVGGRISSGMAREALAAAEALVDVRDLTYLGDEPPDDEHMQRLDALTRTRP